MKLYHCVNARSFRALWALEELDLNYELEVVPFPPRQHVEGFVDINPLGTIPAFIDGDLLMTESSAICQYLADKTPDNPLAVPPAHRDYGAYLNWLHHGEATLTFPQTLVLRYRQLEPPHRRQPQVVEDYARWYFGRLRLLKKALALNDHLCAGRFTMADISVGYALMLSEDLALDAGFPPEIRAYIDRLKQRPAWQRAQRIQVEAALKAGVSPIAPARESGSAES